MPSVKNVGTGANTPRWIARGVRGASPFTSPLMGIGGEQVEPRNEGREKGR